MDGVRGRGRYGPVLRWYPAPWRARYGDELEALLEDTYGDGRLPVATRLALMRSGTVERLRRCGWGRGVGARGRVRSGSLAVLAAWAMVVVGGSVFAKTAEHWDGVTPPADRWLPAAGYAAVLGAALAGAAAVALAAFLCLPSFVRGLRRGGWFRVRRPTVRAAAITTLTGLTGLGVVVWAHHLDGPHRNGAYWPYTVAALVGTALVAAMLASWVLAAGAAVVESPPPDRVLRACGVLSVVVTLAIAVVLAGTVTWWWSVAAHAPWFFGGGRARSAAAPVPAPLAAASLSMVVGLALASGGAWRVVRSLPGLVHHGPTPADGPIRPWSPPAA